uniref:Protein BTN n=1 Tax=Zooxanthella nutricula TaxID=1333877 RepID=A0A7S2VKK6_9DINO
MNAGASKIHASGIGVVYLANIFPTLVVKLTAPYWFHYISYRGRVWLSALLMVACLVIVAWAESSAVKLFGVALVAFQSGVGESSMLAMASFYDSKKCLAAWSSGTGFAGILGYFWSILFTQAIDACFQVQLMVGLWIPVAWLVVFHAMLEAPWIDSRRFGGADAEVGAVAAVGAAAETESEATAGSSTNLEAQAGRDLPVTAALTFRERFSFTLTLWPFMVPLFLVYASEYIIQSGVWSGMGFPVTDADARHSWYQWANFTYQVGVFISRSLGGLMIFSVPALWAGPIMQIVMLAFFGAAAAVPFGGWWLIVPALVVGLLGGFVYVQAFVLISHRVDPTYVELALTSASVADTFGIILANVASIMVQGCLFGRLGIMDPKPDFTCGYDIWEAAPAAAANATAVAAAVCFPGVTG